MTLPQVNDALAILSGALVVAFGIGAYRAGRSLHPQTNAGPRWMVITWILGAAWLALLAYAATSGWIRATGAMPPPILRIMGFGLLIVLAIAVTPLGEALHRGIPLSWLVGFQVFRFPLELLLSQFHHQGKIPAAMTFHGRNFDIATGVLAIVVAWLVRREAQKVRFAAVWNWLGMALLANVVTIAVRALPGPFYHAAFAPANRLPLEWPGVWILFCVQMALLGHLLVFRKIGPLGTAGQPTRLD
jgi:hypothetical protein